jgi:hypothetical protein
VLFFPDRYEVKVVYRTNESSKLNMSRKELVVK